LKEKQISKSALWTAYIRAYHVMYDDPKIFNDSLAHQMITDEVRITIEQGMAGFMQLLDPVLAASCPDRSTALAWAMRAMAGPANIICRARYTEDCLEQAIRQGVQQYVILGAGMDTFAFRRKELLDKIQVFEVDHPDMQAYKRRHLAEVGWEKPAQLHFIPVDFTQESLTTALNRELAYNPETLSFFSWLGVTYYLPRDAVFSTLRAITDIAPVGSKISFDYHHTDIFVPEKTSKAMQLGMEQMRRMGEPIITGFEPSSLATDLTRLGLRIYEDLNQTDVEERYFKGRTDGYHAIEHVHLALAVVNN
jgi:methyltransferase (TIGR00027 family)